MFSQPFHFSALLKTPPVWKSHWFVTVWFAVLASLVCKHAFAFLSRLMLFTQTGTSTHALWDLFPHRSVSVDRLPSVSAVASSVPGLYCNWEMDQITNIASPVHPLLITHSSLQSFISPVTLSADCLLGAAVWWSQMESKLKLDSSCKCSVSYCRWMDVQTAVVFEEN